MQSDVVQGKLQKVVSLAEFVPFRQVRLKEGEPIAHNCHVNVDRWVAENPADRPIRGWLVASNLSGAVLDKHSVVCGGDGTWFDITPLNSPTPFVAHPGTEAEFQSFPDQVFVFPGAL